MLLAVADLDCRVVSAFNFESRGRAGSNPAGGSTKLMTDEASLHRAFHYHPSTVLISLK